MTRLLALALVPVAGLVVLLVTDDPRSGKVRVPTRATHATRPVLHDEPFVDLDAVAAEQAEIAAYLAAEARAVAAYLEAMRPRIEVDWARWERLHVCEQRDSWYANGHNPADGAGLTFQGGLGMSTGAWQMAVRAAAARGVILPPSALQATPEEQMTAAQAFYDAHGWGWACKV